MASNQQFCLRWNNHQRTLISVFDSLLESGTLVDCTLAAEGQYLKAHKVVLSACSPYLGILLSTHHEKHPILILKDISFQELKAMLDYMYKGEVNISQELLGTFLKAAESLQIKGLTEGAGLNPEAKDFEERIIKRSDRKNANVPLSNHNPAMKTKSPPRNSINDMQQQQSTWNHQRFASQNYNRPNTPPCIRDGSISPISRKKRKQPHPMPNNANPEELVATQITENHQDIIIPRADSPATIPESVTSNVPTGGNNAQMLAANFMNINNLKNEVIEKTIAGGVGETKNSESSNTSTEELNTKLLNPEVLVKTEPRYFETKESPDGAHYDDSVEEMTGEDEDEDIDESDIPRPGPSHSEDSQPYGSYAVSCDSDGVSSGQLDCQGVDMKQWKLNYMSNWEAWSAAHPGVPCIQGIQQFSPNSSSGGSMEYIKEGVECPDCGRHYKLKSSLRNHQKWECGKEPQFRCPYCNYRAKQKMHVARHIERMHREKLTMAENCIINNNSINSSNNNATV